ncbi:MAG: cell division ATP-binding protein FtsE [Candidatus Wildermuthbacteria bacterium RIFCSPHIGHO2_02_FULL_47_12]|uniref:Cell division ATP-binding protein FtsE n=1 Tax=Candidatus Wildermuthbacteria bacterium RIFCSPHIGHO2_02_FULL_47_12 TaxID=1802451 RepID=A0A1G2R3Y0_9BACT|nr:MAG: cell division ATP-binding protein FtsE [Candidatus Wildermuthbacteria bacterium RIFCSPHIGHO2_02_FULL_47_12]
MISFQKVTKAYSPSSIALSDVSFEVKQGEFVSLVGKSGAGKTTLLKLLLAEERPTQGNVFFEDQDVARIPSSLLPHLRRKIGTVFQDYKLLHSKTAYENIAYVMEVMGATDAEIERDVAGVLEIVGLLNRSHHYPMQLSGGEKQRVAIARALIHRPEVIVADEPTGNLDPYHTADIIRLLVKINELGTTVILATHNKEVINHLGKRVITLEQGKVVRDEERGKFIL